MVCLSITLFSLTLFIHALFCDCFFPQLLKAFDYGQIEEFQQYFSLLDIDNSGDLSDKEIRILLNALDIQVGARICWTLNCGFVNYMEWDGELHIVTLKHFK